MERFTSKAKEIWNGITIEPVFFFFALAHGFYAIISKTLYISKVCNVNLNYSAEICDNIQNYTEAQIEVQKYVSSLQAYNSVIQAIPACIYSLFAGPWSDSHGRKLLIICSTFGYVLNNAVFMINTYFFYELKAEWLLFEALQDCTGGSTCFFLASYSYITDISDPKTRTRRFAFLDGLFPLGFYLGNSLSAITKAKLGFMFNFSLGMLFSLVSMAYTLIFVRDSRKERAVRLVQQRKVILEELETEAERDEHKLEWKKHDDELKARQGRSFFASMFDLKNLKEGWVAVLKKREFHKRAFIILLIMAFEIEIFISNGKMSSSYLYFRRHLGWGEMEFSRYITVLGVIGLLAQYVAVPFFSERLKFHDSTISLMDAVTSCINQFILAFATAEWVLYIGATISFLDFTSTTVFRSLISKSIQIDEVGKVFSIIGMFQALMPFAAGPTFGFLYRSTVATFPAAFLLVCAGLKIIQAVLVFAVNIGMRREERRHKKFLENEQEMEETKKLLMITEEKENREREKEKDELDGMRVEKIMVQEKGIQTLMTEEKAVQTSSTDLTK